MTGPGERARVFRYFGALAALASVSALALVALMVVQAEREARSHAKIGEFHLRTLARLAEAENDLKAIEQALHVTAHAGSTALDPSLPGMATGLRRRLGDIGKLQEQFADTATAGTFDRAMRSSIALERLLSSPTAAMNGERAAAKAASLTVALSQLERLHAVLADGAVEHVEGRRVLDNRAVVIGMVLIMVTCSILGTMIFGALRSSLVREQALRQTLQESERRAVQAQRLEALGRLAGGVAHDFNNILTAILGHADLLEMSLSSSGRSADDVEQIRRAAERAASLTRQLLVFSRQQGFEAVVLDLNEVLAAMEPMLRRLIGEDLRLDIRRDPALGRVKADRSQVEQVVLNLMINAREAMPGGGALTVETGNVSVDGERSRRTGMPPGPYIRLRISDTGTGMDEGTRARIFEPFFTTKEAGTGLGLATVYGVVTRCEGQILVESAPGAGSRFEVYLPRTEEPLAEDEGRSRATGGATETILVVEDEDAVREVACRMLEGDGYTVLRAAGGAKALEICNRPGISIDLILTDVIMPGMRGPDLFERARPLQPGAAVLYMSGYTDDVLRAEGGRDEGASLIRKPFSAGELRKRVRDEITAMSRRAARAG